MNAGRLLFFGSLLLSATIACSGTQVRDSNAPISLGDWCKTVSSKVCDLTAKACFNGMSGVADGCKDTAIPGCLAGRDPQMPSGRTGADLNACMAKLAPLTCQALGAGMGSGELSICSVNIGGGTATPVTPTAPSDPTPPPAPPIGPSQPPPQ